MDIAFYAVRNDVIEKTLPRLIEKIYEQKLNVHLLCNSDEQLKTLDASLWTYSTLAFLPHGKEEDPEFTHHQNPIWLSTTLNFKNRPEVLVLLKPMEIDKDSSFKRVLYFYDIHQENAHEFSELYQKFQKENKAPVLWQQTEKGVWQK